jgi:hypothetical protein
MARLFILKSVRTIFLTIKFGTMKNVLMLLAALVVSALAIQQIIGGKKIASREDDPSIPPQPTSAF